MPIGTGAETLQNIPAQPFIVDPAAFFQMTRKQVINAGGAHALADPGGTITRQLLQAGIVSKLHITFVGSLNVATAAVTTGANWPYGFLDPFKLSANGQNDLISCDGVDLHALRFARFPAYDERVDDFPGSVGGGDSVAIGDHDLHLTWEVPIAMDDTSLIGSLFAQSAATSLSVTLGTATLADLFSANPANATFTGDWYITETLFDVPIDAEGQMVTPDLSRLHGFQALDTSFTQVGEVRTALIRSSGQLSRLFLSVKDATHSRLQALPSAADADSIDQVRLEYGAGQRPLVYNPAATLLSVNNQHYGAVLPYDYLAFDFVRENPPRDVILMQGVTELAVVPTVNAAATITAGVVRAVQETLF